MATYAHTVIAGTTDVYEHTIGFEYSRATDIEVFIDGVEIEHGSGAGKYVFSSAGTAITFEDGSEPQTGEELVIKRVTDLSTAAVSFVAGGGATQIDLNGAVEQLRYAVDELQVPAYDSGWQSVDDLVTGAADIEYVHNLGAVPTRVQVQLKCTSGELGYVTGDVIVVGTAPDQLVFPVSTTAFTASWQAANTATSIPNASDGTNDGIDNTKWSYRILAWR
ncbi:MAG: hypothetical protein V3W02_05195 [Gammaproteobacteria bacterium]